MRRVMEFATWASKSEKCRMLGIEEYLGSASGREWCWERKRKSRSVVELCDVSAEILFPSEEKKIMKRPMDLDWNDETLMESKRVCTGNLRPNGLDDGLLETYLET